MWMQYIRVDNIAMDPSKAKRFLKRAMIIISGIHIICAIMMDVGKSLLITKHITNTGVCTTECTNARLIGYVTKPLVKRLTCSFMKGFTEIWRVRFANIAISDLFIHRIYKSISNICIKRKLWANRLFARNAANHLKERSLCRNTFNLTWMNRRDNYITAKWKDAKYHLPQSLIGIDMFEYIIRRHCSFVALFLCNYLIWNEG